MTFKDHAVQLPDHFRANHYWRHYPNASWMLTGISTTSLGNLFHSFTIPTIDKCFLIARLNLLCCSFVTFPHALLWVSREKRPAPSSLCFPFSGLNKCSIFLQIKQMNYPQPLVRHEEIKDTEKLWINTKWIKYYHEIKYQMENYLVILRQQMITGLIWKLW